MRANVAVTHSLSKLNFDIHKRLLLCLLIVFAIFANRHPLPLLLDYQLNFAPVLIWLVYLLFGLRWSWFGCICLAAAAALTMPDYGTHLGFWQHWAATGTPHATAMLILELGTITIFYRKYFKKNLVVLVGGYWVFLGMPAHILVHGMSPFTPSLIPHSIDNMPMNLALVEFINALLNVVCATMIASLLPAPWLVNSQRRQTEQRFSDYLFNILALAVACPALIFIILSAQPARENLKQLTVDRLQSDVKFVDLQVQIWFSKRIAEIGRFAKVGVLQKEANLLREHATELTDLFPEVRHLRIVGSDTREILSFGSKPSVDSGNRSWSVAQARISHATQVKEIDPPRTAGTSSPSNEQPSAADLLIVMPIFDETPQNRFLGAVLCELDASSLGELLTDVSNRTQSRMSLFDSKGREITPPGASSLSKAAVSSEIAAARQMKSKEAITFVHYPAADSSLETRLYLNANDQHAFPSSSNQFIESRYAEFVTIIPAPLPVAWSIVVTLDAGGPTSQIEQGYIQTIEILLAVIFFGLGLVKAGSQKVTESLSELAELTSELSQHSIPLAKANFLAPPFAEIRVLQENFSKLTNSLIARFADLAQARSELESRVDERTALLRATNDSLAKEITVRQQLTEDRDRIIDILQASADFVCMFKPSGEVLWLNAFAYRTLELGPNQELSQLQIKSFLPDWASRRLVGEAIPAAQNSGYWVGESAILSASGNAIPVSQMVIAHREPGGAVRFLSSVMRDMRQFKKIQDELETARLDAELANRTKTLFMANMSHEIRTPVAVIRGFSELLATQAKVDQEQARWLSAILSSSKQLELLINDILDISKVERGVVQFEICKTSLSAIISEIQSSMQFAADQKHIELRFLANGYLPETIETDPHRVKQILFNLIGNAIKFTTSGSVDVIVTMKPSPWSQNHNQEPLSAVDQWLSFLVRDTGEGIAREHQEKLFKPFVQADASITRRFGGTGLGLFLSKQLAVNLGGDLSLRESVPGKGSCFEFNLRHRDNLDSHLICDFSPPQVLGQLKPPGDSIPTSTTSELSEWSHLPQSTFVGRRGQGKAPTKQLDGIRVLVVEDSPDLRLLIGQILKSQGAVASFATNGAEGVNCILADGRSFEVVLMDIQMPVMDGYTATAKLRDAGYQNPVIALTAHALVGERDRCIAAGFSDYLTKPVEVKMLIQKVLHWFQKQREPGPMDSHERQLAAAHLDDANGMPGAKPESQTRA
jgi:signal transduction histidine kinase/CheY-like chemotaxis protein